MKNTICFLFLSILAISCASNPQYNDPIPPHDNFTIVSKILNETRVINVWTPPNYNSKSDSFPVLYMPDGGLKEDFPHFANTLAKLVESKTIPPIILVGIENTERKRDLTGPTEVAKDKEIAPVVGGSEKFRSFIKSELIPEIKKRYRTTAEKGIIGESLSGLFIVETFLLEPTTFDFYIAFDPALWWNDQYLVKTAKEHLKNLPAKEIRFWFAGSSVQKDTPFILELSKIIESESPKSLVWKYSDEPNEKHSTVFRATKEKALTWILNAKGNK